MASVEDTIKNGLKQTKRSYDGSRKQRTKYVIENGVKETRSVEEGTFTSIGFGVHVEETIQNGVKETDYRILRVRGQVKDIIENGIKETNATNFPSGECGYIKEILRNGIKEVQPLPAQDGNRDWGNYYYRKGNPTKPFNEYLDDAIRFGVKETKTPGDGDIVSTVEWMKENNSTSYPKMIEEVIQSGKLNS